MLKEIFLIFFTTFGFTKSDVKLLELPKESKNFGASIKDFYKNDYRGSYTYIFENENGHKHRQDGIYGEKRGYYTFKAPLPDGRTFTVCYYTRNGYHAKTTIIEVEDVEAFCDMIIEQSGNFKIQQTQTSSTLSTKTQSLLQKTENDSKIKFKNDEKKRLFTTNRQKSSKSFDLLTPFRIHKTNSMNKDFSQINNRLTQSSSRNSVKTTETENIIEANPTINSKEYFSSDNNTQGLDKFEKTKIPFIIIEEPIENKFDTIENEPSAISTELRTTNATESSLDIPLTLSFNDNISEIGSLLTSSDTDSAPPPNAPQFKIPTPISFQQPSSSSESSITFCDDLNQDNENPNNEMRILDCAINILPTSKPKIDALIAEVFKYSLKRPSDSLTTNATEIITPSKLFLPPFIDDDSDLLRPSLDLIPPVPNNIILTTNSPIDTTLITSSERPTFKRTPSSTYKTNKITKSTTEKLTTNIKRTTVAPITGTTTLRTTKKTTFSTPRITTTKRTSSRTTTSALTTTTQRTTNTKFSTTTPRTIIPRFTTTTLKSSIPRFTFPRTTTLRSSTFRTTTPKFTTTTQEKISRFTTTISKTTTTRFTTTNPRTINSRFTISTKTPTTTLKFSTKPSASSAATLNNNIRKPSLDILPPFEVPNLELLSPIENEPILFDVRILDDNSKTNSSNIVSRSISSTYETNEECKHGILRTNPIGISEYVSPTTFEEIEAIRNIIKIYGCQSISKSSRRKRLQSHKYRLETEPDLKNCRLDIVKLDNNERVSYLDPQSLEEFNTLKKLNRIFGCYKTRF